MFSISKETKVNSDVLWNFLNNIHDSMEMVNAELDPFLDLSSQGVFDELWLNLANCLQLLVKYRLEQEHWPLFFSDLNKAKYSDYLAGDFINVDVKPGICRLKNICEICIYFKYTYLSI